MLCWPGGPWLSGRMHARAYVAEAFASLCAATAMGTMAAIAAMAQTNLAVHVLEAVQWGGCDHWRLDGLLRENCPHQRDRSGTWISSVHVPYKLARGCTSADRRRSGARLLRPSSLAPCETRGEAGPVLGEHWWQWSRCMAARVALSRVSHVLQRSHSLPSIQRGDPHSVGCRSDRDGTIRRNRSD